MAGAGHLHVGSYYLLKALRPDVGQLFGQAKQLGLTTSLDPGWDPKNEWGPDILRALRHVDVFLPNRVEAMSISQSDTPEKALESLGEYAGTVVVKAGGDGCLVWDRGQMFASSGFEVPVQDVTSAGDVFNAGFIYGFLRRWDARECARFANACGAISVGETGSIGMVSGVDQVERFLAVRGSCREPNWTSAESSEGLPFSTLVTQPSCNRGEEPQMPTTNKGQHTLSEILNQANAWTEVIKIVKAKSTSLLDLIDGIDEAVFTGCGSALNVSCTLAPTFQHFTGIRARAVPAADVTFFPRTVFVPGSRCLVVLLSRSGETTETVMACEQARSRQMKTLSITCYPESALARATTESLVLEPANEKSVTTTQSLTSMVLTGQVLTAIVSGKDEYLAQLEHLPGLGQQVIERYHSLGRQIAEIEQITKFAFVGSGPYYGLARECQLKVKEMVLLPSDAYPLMDYRHGPKSNVDGNMLVTVLMSDSAKSVELEFLQEMRGLGGSIFVICDKADREIERLADFVAVVESGLPEFVRDILYMPPVHYLAYYKSLLCGQDPDNPVNLTYWVETSTL